MVTNAPFSQHRRSHQEISMTSRAYVEFEENPRPQYLDLSFKAIGRSNGSSLSTSDNVSSGSGWPLELEQRCADWTEAFKGWPLRDIEGQPSKLVQLYFGVEALPEKPVHYSVVRPEQRVQYAAVSYAWDDWDEKIEDMLCRLKGLMEPSGLMYCWIDQLCIDQTSKHEKAAEIKRMRGYYAQAAITYVMVPDWYPTFTWELAGFSMSHEQAATAAKDILALEETEWASRVWTMQEASLSGRTVFVGSSVVKSAAELAVAHALDWLTRRREVFIKSQQVYLHIQQQKGYHMLYDQKGWPSRSEDGLAHAVWSRKTDGGTYVIVEDPQLKTPITATHLLRDRVLMSTTRYPPTEYEYLDDVWEMAGERYCSEEEDRVYGMLGLVRRGDEVAVEYGIGFEEAVRRAAEKGLLSSGVLLAETSSTEVGRSWCPAQGKENRFRGSIRSRELTDMRQPLQLTKEGLCTVRALRFEMRLRPESSHTNWRRPIPCKTLDGGREFNLAFRYGIPEGNEWREDWLAVIESSWPHDATLIKYETKEDGSLYKLQALEAEIIGCRTKWLGEFRIG